MEDWEDELVPQLLKKELPKSNWDDEDVDDDEVKESWEDEDEPAPRKRSLLMGRLNLQGHHQEISTSMQMPLNEDFAEAGAAEPVKAPEKKADKRGATKEADTKGKQVEVAKETPLDPVAEKIRQQRLVEEADYRSTKDLFGKKGDDKTLDNFIPKSESDFSEYAELISHKLRPYEKSYHYIGLLKAVMRLSMTTLKAADAKEVASSVTAIANEKLKAEKEANASKKKTGVKKKQLHVDRPDDDVVIAAYDDVDDYDFI